MAFGGSETGSAWAVRSKELAQLLGIGEDEASGSDLAGRLYVIQKLRTARDVEIARGRASSWLYDINRHLNLCAALRREYEALAQFCAETVATASLKEAPPAAAETGATLLPFPKAAF